MISEPQWAAHWQCGRKDQKESCALSCPAMLRAFSSLELWSEGSKCISMLAGGQVWVWKKEEVKLQSRNPTWSLKLGCRKLNWGGLWNNFCNYTVLCLEGGDRQHQLHIQIQSFALGHRSIEDRWWKESLSETQVGTEGSRRSHVDAVRVCCLSWAVDMQDRSLRPRKRKGTNHSLGPVLNLKWHNSQVGQCSGDHSVETS